ncbi:unnamed protein product [Owenia fusiformis]|uniref:Uncharacterized protein n=1 Tax=Owenia fusiformis TaxID=6347 RepID=A0A8J1XQU9_OWEFU|nr:unnamed protein product [Owenia fusiformis]
MITMNLVSLSLVFCYYEATCNSATLSRTAMDNTLELSGVNEKSVYSSDNTTASNDTHQDTRQRGVVRRDMERFGVQTANISSSLVSLTISPTDDSPIETTNAFSTSAISKRASVIPSLPTSEGSSNTTFTIGIADTTSLSSTIPSTINSSIATPNAHPNSTIPTPKGNLIPSQSSSEANASLITTSISSFNVSSTSRSSIESTEADVTSTIPTSEEGLTLSQTSSETRPPQISTTTPSSKVPLGSESSIEAYTATMPKSDAGEIPLATTSESSSPVVSTLAKTDAKLQHYIQEISTLKGATISLGMILAFAIGVIVTMCLMLKMKFLKKSETRATTVKNVGVDMTSMSTAYALKNENTNDAVVKNIYEKLGTLGNDVHVEDSLNGHTEFNCNDLEDSQYGNSECHGNGVDTVEDSEYGNTEFLRNYQDDPHYSNTEFLRNDTDESQYGNTEFLRKQHVS